MKVQELLVWLLLCVQGVTALSYADALKKVGKDGLIHVTDKNYKQLIKNEDFSLIIYLTAEDPRVGCTLCTQFGPQYKAIGYSYALNLKDSESGMFNPIDSKDDMSKVIFAISDYMSAQEYFGRLGLTAVPRLFFYEPGRGPQLTGFTNEFSFLGVENTDGVTRWIAQNIPGLDVKYLSMETPTSNSMVFTGLVFFLILLVGLYKFRGALLKVVQNKRVWEFFSLSLIILFISGHMYNQIRNTDVYKVGPNGNTIYFAQGHNLQYGAETQIMSVIYGALSVSLYVLICVVPKLKTPRTILMTAAGASLMVFVGYSYIVEVYHLKSPTYPFHLWKLGSK